MIKTNINKVLIGIVLTLPAAGIVYTEYIKGTSVIDDTVKVVVLKDNTESNTPLVDSSMFEIQNKKLLDIQGIDGIITDVDQILGLETKNFIPKNTILVEQYFEEGRLNLKENEFVFRIPEEWIYSHPQTIRRLDKIYLYPINTTKKDSSGFQANQKMPEGNPVIESVVLFAKDSSNREVLDTDKNDRYNGSSSISNIEIKVTTEDVKLLESYINNGYKFIIYYR